jgi:hypothetical protein
MIRRSVIVAAGVAFGLAALGLIIGLVSDRDLAATIAVVYYLVGCVMFLIGMFPTGGFSLTRGTMTQRRPIGSRLEPILLLGLLLVGLGVVLDVTRPF